MKKFLYYLALISVICVLLLLLLEGIYTAIYHSNASRNKVFYTVNQTESQHYDVIFLGSSRAENHIDTRILNAKGLKTYNFGMSGSRLQESALLLQLMTARKDRIKTVVVEVDLNIANDGYSEGNRALFLPFLNTNSLVSSYYQDKIDNFKVLKYLPFYRYMMYDYELGIRQLFLTVINKKQETAFTDGFAPLIGAGSNLKLDIFQSKPQKNESYELIKQLCKQHGIKLIAITTPLCENTLMNGYFDQVSKVYPEVVRLEKVVTEDAYFSSCGHLNEAGALIFTEYLYKNQLN